MRTRARRRPWQTASSVRSRQPNSSSSPVLATARRWSSRRSSPLRSARFSMRKAGSCARVVLPPPEAGRGVDDRGGVRPRVCCVGAIRSRSACGSPSRQCDRAGRANSLVGPRRDGRKTSLCPPLRITLRLQRRVATFLGNPTWYSYLALSLGTLSWHSLLALSFGTFSWQSFLALSLSVLSWCDFLHFPWQSS